MKLLVLPLLAGFILLLPSSVVAQNPANDATAPEPGTDVIQVIADPQPTEQGLTFDRNGVKSTKITVDGNSSDVWVADEITVPDMPWLRSFRFKVTDPRFQNGRHAMIDVEATCYLEHPGEVMFHLDTADGNKKVFGDWANGKDWATFRFTVSDAYFGGRPDTGKEKPSLEGFDLRIDDPVSPLYLRSLRIIGYDTKNNVAWKRMLKINSLTAQTPGGILAVERGPGQKLNITVQNLAQVAADIHYRIAISDYRDKPCYAAEGKISVPPASSPSVPLTFDTSDWALGPYEGKLQLYSDENPQEILCEQTFRLGVISSATLDKARPGEFLYGLDAANTWNLSTHTPTAFAYYRLMGVDILRDLYSNDHAETVENVGKALSDLAAGNVQGQLMCDPPRDQDPAARDTKLKQKDAFLEEVARLYGGSGVGKIHFFELGNEPDLSFFYPGPMSNYAYCFQEMREAIKRGTRKAGLLDTDTTVMNGGLSFAGADGPRRSEEFIQALDPDSIDAIAYHGHGPGIVAERSAYERVYAVAQKYGKAGHPFIETESGFSGIDHSGLEEQARTVVEKMVYAQSEHEPTFMFFRLFMTAGKAGDTDTEGAYGMTDNLVEPHPSVLAYRNLVERLRHYSFISTLDLLGQGGIRDVDGYLFAEKDAQGGLTGRKVAVLFAEKPAQNDLRLRLDASGSPVSDATLYDMYGNPSPVTVPAGNVATIPATVDPVFLSWKSSGDASKVEVVPSLLSFNSATPLLANADNTVEVVVRNAQPQPLDATVSLIATTRLTAQAQPDDVKVSVPADQTATVAFQVPLEAAQEPLRLPLWWKAFTDVDMTQTNLPQLTSIPESLSGTKGLASGQFVWATNNRLDFAKVAGGFGEHRPALAFTYLDSAKETNLPCAASADWWMAWYVNGTKVYDTLNVGNRGGTLADHLFDLPLKKGRNLIVVEVQSGSGGWSLDFGGPKERQAALTGANTDKVEITLKSEGATLASLTAPVRIQDCIPALVTTDSFDQPATWMPLEPLALLDESAVTNFWMKEPDASRWYGGKKDLSATVWLRDSGQSLQLYVAVTDDTLVQATSVAQLAQCDSLHVVLANDAGKQLLDVIGGLIGGQPVLNHFVADVTLHANRESPPGQDPQTLYRLEIPKSLVGSQPFRLNISISDNDGNYLKQTLDLGDVKNPVAGVRLKTND